jgi:hypothetical protein
MTERTILLCIPELQDFIGEQNDMGSMDKNSLEKVVQRYKNFQIEMTSITEQINEAVTILHDHYQNKNSDISIPCVSVRMVTLNNESFEFNTQQNSSLRVCIEPEECVNIKSHVIRQFSSLKDGISHLVYIKADCDGTQTQWDNHREEPFDAIIKSDMKKASYIILSIIFDILLYYVFNFPNLLKYRKSFAEKKTTMLKEEAFEDLVKIYGSDKMDNNVYLPVTMGVVNEVADKYESFGIVETIKQGIIGNIVCMAKTEKFFESLLEDFHHEYIGVKRNGVYSFYYDMENWDDLYKYVEDKKKLIASNKRSLIYSIIRPPELKPILSADEVAKIIDKINSNIVPDNSVSIVAHNEIFSFSKRSFKKIFEQINKLGLLSYLIFFELEGR